LSEENSDLSEFLSRKAKVDARNELIAGWHLRAHAEGGIKLPYDVHDTWIRLDVYEYNKDDEYVLNVEKSLDALAVVTQFASKVFGAVEKDYSSSDFELKITLEDGTVIRYEADREAVCTKVVVGYEDVPERVTPAYRKEIVEWECDPVSLLARKVEVDA